MLNVSKIELERTLLSQDLAESLQNLAEDKGISLDEVVETLLSVGGFERLQDMPDYIEEKEESLVPTPELEENIDMFQL